MAFALVRLTFEFIGAAAAPEDFALFKQRLPKMLEWLFTAPWWVPSILLPCVFLAYAAWVFRPDMTVEKAFREYKASNDKAWEFMPKFQAFTENMEIREGQLLQLIERVEQRCQSMENELSKWRLENSTIVNSSLVELKEEQAKQLRLSLAHAQIQLRREIAEEVKMAEQRRQHRMADNAMSPDDPNAGTPYGL